MPADDWDVTAAADYRPDEPGPPVVLLQVCVCSLAIKLLLTHHGSIAKLLIIVSISNHDIKVIQFARSAPRTTQFLVLLNK